MMAERITICVPLFFYDIITCMMTKGEVFMKKKLMPVLIGLGLIGLAGCGNGEESSSDGGNGETQYGEVLATSDAGDITVDDILNEMGTTQVANQTFQLVLDQILQDKYSDEVDEAEVNEQVDAEMEQYGGEEQFEMMMTQQQPGMTAENYREQRIASTYHDRFFTEKFDITDEEAMENAAEGAHILVSVDEEGEDGLSDEEAQEKAEDLITEIEDGADFGEVAEEESDDPGSAAEQGSLGLVTEGQMVPEFEEALFALEPGEMTSEPVESEFGYHIIQRGEEENLDEELSAVKSQMVNQRIQEDPGQVLTFYQELLDEYNVSFENDEIESYIEETYMTDGEESASEEEETEEEDSEDTEDAPAEDTEEAADEETTEEE